MEILLLLIINLIINMLPYLLYTIIGLSTTIIIYEYYFNIDKKNNVTQNKNKLYKMDVDFITHPRPRM